MCSDPSMGVVFDNAMDDLQVSLLAFDRNTFALPSPKMAGA